MFTDKDKEVSDFISDTQAYVDSEFPEYTVAIAFYNKQSRLMQGAQIGPAPDVVYMCEVLKKHALTKIENTND
jgi:hypothetical protein